MFDIIKKWFQGFEVSEINLLVLPFVQISLQPREENVQEAHPTTPLAERQGNTRKHEMRLTISADQNARLVSEKLLEIKYAYKTPIEFRERHRVSYYPTKSTIAELFSDNFTIVNYPVFDDHWTLLEGNVDFHYGELIWIVGRFRNVSRRILYDVSFNLSQLPFLRSLPGFVMLKSQTINYIGSPFHKLSYCENIVEGQVISNINANDVVYVHSLCHVTDKFNSNATMQFRPYMGKDISVLTQRHLINSAFRIEKFDRDVDL